MIGIIKNILSGVGSGLITAFLGYMKNKGEEFDCAKFVQTLVVGGVVGGVAQSCGMAYNDAYDYLASIGVISLIEYIKKSIWRRCLSKYF